MNKQQFETHQRLLNIRKYRQELKQLEDQEREIREALTSVTPHLGGSTSGTKDPHKYDRVLIVADLIKQKQEQIAEAKLQMLTRVYQMPESTHRTCLIGYYLNCKTIEQLAYEMNYSYSQIKRIRAAALSAYAATYDPK